MTARATVRSAVRAVKRRIPLPVAAYGFGLMDRAGWRYAVPGERHTCAACGAAEIEHLHPLSLHDRPDASRVGFATGCRRCGVVFANPMPSAAALAHMYSPEGDWGRPRQQADRGRTRPASRYFVRLLQGAGPECDVRRPRPGSAVLDFGCGPGELLDLLQDLGWATYGIEPAEKTAFRRHHELEAIPDEPLFELAIANHVLEHVPDPLDVLRALHRCLTPSGRLFVSVPRLDTLPVHGDYRYCLNDRAHIFGYTRDAMATLLAMAGFETIDLNPPPGEEGDDRRALRRLRLIGRKGGAPAAVPEPLAAARRAFAAWHARQERAAQTRPAWLSTRAAAAVMNFARNR